MIASNPSAAHAWHAGSVSSRLSARRCFESDAIGRQLALDRLRQQIRRDVDGDDASAGCGKLCREQTGAAADLEDGAAWPQAGRADDEIRTTTDAGLSGRRAPAPKSFTVGRRQHSAVRNFVGRTIGMT